MRTIPTSSIKHAAIRGSLVVVLIVSLAGCGLSMKQRTAVRQFGAATAQLADTASKSFVGIREDVIRLRSEMYKLGSGSIDLTHPSSDLDGPLQADQLAIRLRAVDTMKEYGDLLQRLVGDQDAAEIQKSANSLVSNLREMKDFSEERSAALTSVVNKIAGLFIARKKEKAARVAILTTKEPMVELATILADDFDSTTLHWIGALTQTHKEIANTLKKEIENLDRGKKRRFPGIGERTLTDADIALLVQAYNSLELDAQKSADRAEKEGKAIGEMIKAFTVAHNEAVYVIQSSDLVSINSIPAFFTQVNEFKRQVDTIRGK